MQKCTKKKVKVKNKKVVFSTVYTELVKKNCIHCDRLQTAFFSLHKLLLYNQKLSENVARNKLFLVSCEYQNIETIFSYV